MAIPENIHPACLLAASFGFELPKRVEEWDRNKVLGGIAQFLGITLEQIEEALAWFSVQGAEHLEEFLQDPDWIHNVPELMEKWLPIVFGKIEGLLGDHGSNLTTRIESFISQNKIPIEDLQILLTVAMQGEYLLRDEFQISLHRRLRLFCTALAEKDSAQYFALARQRSRQLVALSPFAMNPNGPSRLHAWSHLNEALRLAQGGRLRASAYQAIAALKSAYEGPIHDVVSFVWRLAHPPKGSKDNLPTYGGKRGDHPIKGKIFKEAREWCDNNTIAFPFSVELDALRNSEAHDGYSVEQDGSVKFYDGATLVKTLSHAELLDVVSQEFHFAQMFPQSLVAGDIAIRNRRGEFDGAWQRAKARVPELEARVLVTDNDT